MTDETDVEESGRGLMKALSRYFLGGSEENEMHFWSRSKGDRFMHWKSIIQEPQTRCVRLVCNLQLLLPIQGAFIPTARPTVFAFVPIMSVGGTAKTSHLILLSASSNLE
jgi:hypothetical protein